MKKSIVNANSDFTHYYDILNVRMGVALWDKINK